jgi:hypothetical protein
VRDVVAANGGPDVAAAQGLACASSPSGDLQLLVIDQNNRLWHTLRSVNGNWPFPWGDVQAAVLNQRIYWSPGAPVIAGTTQVSCAIGRNDDMHLVVFDSMDIIWHTIRAADGSWKYQPWQDIEQSVP